MKKGVGYLEQDKRIETIAVSRLTTLMSKRLGFMLLQEDRGILEYERRDINSPYFPKFLTVEKVSLVGR